MLHENKIRCFLALAETQSFTTAANLLYLTQQAVSKNISSLEADLGIRLFTRTSRSVELTPAGQQCYALFSRLMQDYKTSMAEIQLSHAQTTSNIKIGLQSFLDFKTTLEYALSILKESCPYLQVETTRYSPTVLLEHLRAHRLDMILIFRRFISNTSGLRLLPLTSSPRFLMVSQDNPLVRNDSTFETFRTQPFIYDSLKGESREAYDIRAQRDLQVLGMEPSQVIWVPDRDTAYTYAEVGYGVVVGTEMSRMARARNLVAYPTGIEEYLFAVYHENEENPWIERCAQQILQEYHLQKPMKGGSIL